MEVQNDPRVLGIFLAAASLMADAVRVLQSNSAGDNIHVIDPATNKVVGVIEDIEVPHGLVIAPDGSRIYVTDESLRTLDVVDAKTLKVFKRIPLSGRPNNVDVAKDGSHVYVGIRQGAGRGGRHRYRLADQREKRYRSKAGSTTST